VLISRRYDRHLRQFKAITILSYIICCERLIASDKYRSFRELARPLNRIMCPWGIFLRSLLRGHDDYNRARRGVRFQVFAIMPSRRESLLNIYRRPSNTSRDAVILSCPYSARRGCPLFALFARESTRSTNGARLIDDRIRTGHATQMTRFSQAKMRG